MTSLRLSSEGHVVWLTLLVLAVAVRGGECRPWANVTRQLVGVNVKQLQRLQFIKLHILHSLGFSDSQASDKVAVKTPRLGDVGRMRSGGFDTSVVRDGDVHNPQEIVSLSEVVDEENDGTVLQFRLHHKMQGQLEVVSARLWVKVRKRGGSRRPKTVEIRVFQVEEGHQSMLSSLRTRIKKTRWRQLSLPISLVQRMLESSKGSLQLKVECKRCGRLVRLVMPWSRKDRSRSKGKGRGKKFRGSSSSLHHRHRHAKANSTEDLSEKGNHTSSLGLGGVSEGSGKTTPPDSQPLSYRLTTASVTARDRSRGKRKHRKRARSLTSRRSRPKRPRRPYLVINTREK